MANTPPTAAEPSLNGQADHAGAKESYDPFDPAALHSGPAEDFEVESVLTAVPVRRPKRNEFFRVHPEFTCDRLLLERDRGMEKDSYLVLPSVEHLVVEDLRRTRLHVAITKRRTLFVWPIKLPIEGSGNTGQRIFDTASQVAEQAKTLWVKMAWDRELGGYTMVRAKGDLGEPQWPALGFRDILEKAFRSNLIDRPDHEVIRELAGEL